MDSTDVSEQEPEPAAPRIADTVDAISDFALALAEYQRTSEQRALFLAPPMPENAVVAHERLGQDRYLLRPCGGGFRPIEAMQIAADLLSTLMTHLVDNQDEIEKLEASIADGKLDIMEFLTLAYCNQGHELRTMLRRLELDEAVGTFFAVYLARPWRAHAAKVLTEGLDLARWRCGYCPVCGHWASFGHISTAEGKRTLWCLHCTATWVFPRVRCVFCLNSDHEALDILQPEGEDTYRVQACRACRRYIKEVRGDSVPGLQRFDALYLGTPMLDIAAQENGYLRESNLTVRYDNPDGNELLLYRQHPLTEKCVGQETTND